MTDRVIQPVDLSVGAKIRTRRQMAGLSQTALANKLGVTFQQVQKYEKGTNRVSASRLQMIAKVLDMSVAELFSESALGHDPGSDIGQFYSTGEGVKLARAFIKVSDANVRRRVIALVQALADDTDG